MRRRWKYLLAAATAILAPMVAYEIARFDRHFKNWPDTGYTVPEPQLTLASSDFPAFWRDALDTTAGRGLAQALSRQRGALERDIRLNTGIRPTPSRWALWLGPRMLFSRNQKEWLLCLRPGLLFRLAANALAHTTDIDLYKGYRLRAGYEAQFRNSYLMLANNAQTLTRAARFDLRSETREATRNGALAISLHATEAGGDTNAYLYPKEGLPVTVRLEGEAPKATSGGQMPLPDLHDIHQSSILDCLALDAHYVDLVARLPLLDTLGLPDVANMLGIQTLPPEFFLMSEVFNRVPLGELPLRLVVYDFGASAGIPLLHRGFSMAQVESAWSKHPLEEPRPQDRLTRIPYAWGDTEGFLCPLLGEDFTYGCALEGAWAHTANPPANLPKLLLGEASAKPDAPPFQMIVEWDLLAKSLAPLMRQRQLQGDLPGEARAFEFDYGCWLEALAALGRTELTSASEVQGTAVLEGHLAVRAPSAAHE